MIARALAQPESREKFASIALVPMAPDRLKTFMASAVVKWKRLVKVAEIQPE